MRFLLSLLILAEPSSRLDDILSRLGDVFTLLNSGIFASAIFTIGLAWWRGNRNKYDERKAARSAEQNPDTIHLWNLIGEKTPDEKRVKAMLEAINRGAVERAAKRSDAATGSAKPRSKVRFGALRKVKPWPEKARRMWKPVTKDLYTARHHFIPPVATISDSELKTTGDAIAAVKGWLEECHGQETDESLGRISIRSGGGAGKTIFMHRLLLDLSSGVDGAHANGPRRTPIPMLASAETLQRHAEMIAHLRSTTDTLSAFVEVWLRNRNIKFPAKSHETLVSDFKNALVSGEIVLLLDGDDELRQQNLERFALNLLKEVRYWVAAHRFPGPEFVTTHRWIALDDAWGEATVMAHIDQRWAASDSVAAPEKPENVKKVIAEVLRRHDAAARRAVAASSADGKPTSARLTKAEPHWLCQPRNLDLFLDAIDQGKIEDESDIRRAAESQPYLFGLIVDAAVDKIDGTSDLRIIRERLSEIAVSDPTNTRRQAGGRAVMVEDSTAAQLRRLTEIVGYSDKQGRFYFRHAALRGYFIAGQIAHELLDAFHALGPEDELARDETWSKARRDAVECWLRESGTDPVPVIAARLGRGAAQDLRLNPVMRRNLLDLAVSARKRGEGASLSDLDLSEIAGGQLDLHLMKFDRCDFSRAVLKDAELTQATFTECDFHGADFSGADAVGAAFNDCTFGADNAGQAQVKGMAIDRAEFTVRGSVASLQRELLIQRGASLERSRYRGEFGRKFFAAQQAFLGPGVQRLEENHYLRAIEEAVSDWVKKDPASPVYLVDLMAGGSYQRVNKLREKFPQLHVLGIDRDPSAQEPHPNFKWAQFEIHASSSSPSRALDFDITRSLVKAFGKSAEHAHVIVAKKAFHELDRDLQQQLIRECARVLRPGGRLIMFEDTPGLADGATSPESLGKVLSELDVLRHALGADVEDVRRDTAFEPGDVERALEKHHFDASGTEQIAFANTWIMVKDWANLNRHEVRNRYFGSVPEIKQWASEVFGPPRELQFDRYRLNPLMFNELGIQRVLDHLARDGGDRAQVVQRDEAHLSECIWDSERLRVLVDFTKEHLEPGSPLAQALDARDEAIDLQAIDPALGILNRADITAPTFNLPCTVLVFEKT